jgi:Beta-lactamase/Histidine kinase-like ATPase domain
MDKPAKLAGARVHLAGPISCVLGIVLCLPIVFAAQTTPDRVLTVGRPADTGMSEPVLKAAVSLYSEAVARGDVLGAVLLVARHGKVVLYEAVGVRDREKNLLMEKDTPFQIQSMTKPLVASAALILADRGKLQLDDPVSRYIPAFAQGQSQAIRVHNLANHTSEFRIPTNFVPKTNAEIPDGSTLQGEVARFPEIGPAVTPGSSYEFAVETALHEALANAIVHGNHCDTRKKVRVCCGCDSTQGILIVVRDEGEGFDPTKVQSLEGEHVASEHGRGIFLINLYMDETHFENGGRAIHMRKADQLRTRTRPGLHCLRTYFRHGTYSDCDLRGNSPCRVKPSSS